MTVTVNGVDHDVEPQLTVADVVRQLGADGPGSAVAVNDEVVPRTGWAATVLADGDRVEVLTAVQGG
jgi:sulfur carrier protein